MAVPLKRPEFLKLVYLNRRNQAFTLGTGTRSSGPGQMMTGKPEVVPPGWQIAPYNALAVTVVLLARCRQNKRAPLLE